MSIISVTFSFLNLDGCFKLLLVFLQNIQRATVGKGRSPSGSSPTPRNKKSSAIHGMKEQSRAIKDANVREVHRFTLRQYILFLIINNSDYVNKLLSFFVLNLSRTIVFLIFSKYMNTKYTPARYFQVKTFHTEYIAFHSSYVYSWKIIARRTGLRSWLSASVTSSTSSVSHDGCWHVDSMFRGGKKRERRLLQF